MKFEEYPGNWYGRHRREDVPEQQSDGEVSTLADVEEVLLFTGVRRLRSGKRSSTVLLRGSTRVVFSAQVHELL